MLPPKDVMELFQRAMNYERHLKGNPSHENVKYMFDTMYNTINEVCGVSTIDYLLHVGIDVIPLY